MDIATIVISIVALIVSICTYQWNKAKHNLNRLQENAAKFCDCLQDFIELGSEHNLTMFKFEIENVYHITDSAQNYIAGNELQLEFSRRKNNCKIKYRKLMESLDFFAVAAEQKNELIDWFNATGTEFFHKLDQYYEGLFRLSIIARRAIVGNIKPNSEEINFIDAFYDNIGDLLHYCYAFCLLKRNIAGYFGKISLAKVGLFGRSKKAMVYIENEILGTIQEIGFDEAVKHNDYAKIKKFCNDYGEQFAEFVAEERKDFEQILDQMRYRKNQ